MKREQWPATHTTGHRAPLLRSISYYKPPPSQGKTFPFDLPLVKSLKTMEFTVPVTILVGENGTGKSTLLEAMAAAAGSVTVGAHSVKADESLAPARALGKCLKLAWRARTHKGFFLRAEDFFGFARAQAQLKAEMRQRLDEIEHEYANRSPAAKGYARVPFAGSLAEMEGRYGKDLDAQSHGESFLKLFQSRFVPGGLYLLDEPEAPLSPIRQLAFIAMLKEMVQKESQFVIATHSPIIMAFPGADLLSLDALPIERVNYEDLEHVCIMRDFLNNPRAFLEKL